MINWFHIYQGEETPQYSINLAFVTDVNRETEDSWEITTSSGQEYTIEEDDLARFRQATGL